MFMLCRVAGRRIDVGTICYLRWYFQRSRVRIQYRCVHYYRVAHRDAKELRHAQ